VKNKILIDSVYSTHSLQFVWYLPDDCEDVEAANLSFWPTDLGPEEVWRSALMELAGEGGEEIGWEWCDLVEKWVREGI